MSQAPARTLYSATFRRLASRLVPVLDRMAAGDPLRPRRVLVISSALSDHLQRVLAREAPLAGVTFLTLEQFVRGTAESSLFQSRLRPIPPLGGPALMEIILRDLRPRLGPLCPPEGVPGYGLALYETWKDIAEARLGPADLQARAPKFPRADGLRLIDLARIAQEFEERLSRLGYFDQPHLIAKACDILEEDPDGLPTILYGFSDMNTLQRRLALAACRGAAAAFVPADREAPACAFARPFLGWLEAEGFVPDDSPPATEGPLEKTGRRLFGTGSPAPPPEGALQIISAPAASREGFELCREILCEKEKPAAPDSAGILLPSRKDYDPLFREIFAGMGIPITVPDAGAQAACPAGRSLLRMLALKAAGYPRPEVMRFLDEGGLPKTDLFLDRMKDAGLEAAHAIPADWEYRSRDLPYLSGEEGWRNEIDRALSGRDGDPVLESLSVAVEILFEQLGALPETAPPSGHAKKSLEAFKTLTSDLEGSDEIDETVESLNGLDEILGMIPAEDFHRWARLALENAVVRPERVPARFHLMTLQQARGLSFETVAIPGLAEGGFPSRGAQDPILPDALRERLNRELETADGSSGERVADAPERLPLKAGRSAEERFLFWTAIQAAERRVILGYPTGGNGPGEERDCPPSLFLEYLREAAGRVPERAAGAALEREVLKMRSISLVEHELSGMLEQLHGKQRKFALGHLTRRHPGFLRRITAWRDRWKKDELTPFDGVFSDPDLIEWIRENRNPEKKSVAVTSLETFFSCPYQYALNHLLRFGGKDEPERALEAAPDLRGNLYHEAIKRFAERVRKSRKSFGELTSAARRDLIAQSARAAFRAYENENQPPPPVTWRILREAIERDLDIFFKETYENTSGWKPVEMEGGFGREGDPQSAPAEGGKSIRIRGRFDLVEQDENHFRFIDYKSGRYAKPGLVGGANLQGDLYAYHGRERFGEDARVGAAYAFISERGGYQLAEISPETIEDRRDVVMALLGFYVQALDKGCFFPAPSDACQYCDFISVCGPDRVGRSDRKKGHALWVALNELREKTR